jgi:hypothetical protein
VLNAVGDCLSDLDSSDGKEHEDNENDNEEDPEHVKLSQDD